MSAHSTISRSGRAGRPSVKAVSTRETTLDPEKARQDLRNRLRFAGDFVRDVLRIDHDVDPSLLTHHAYLVVVSRIIQALVESKEELTTTDLAALSKVLAEQRRLDISQMEIDRRFPVKVTHHDTLESADRKPLPQGFGRVVEQIYGTRVDNEPGLDDPA